MAYWQPVAREPLRSKEELKIMFPQDIANKISFEEDPNNCYIKVDGTSLGYFEWMRLVQSLPSITQKYGAPKLKTKFSMKVSDTCIRILTNQQQKKKQGI
jgi:hypothetical protein